MSSRRRFIALGPAMYLLPGPVGAQSFTVKSIKLVVGLMIKELNIVTND